MTCPIVVTYFEDHKATFLTFGGLLVTSAIRVLPTPGAPWSWYTFLYDWSHQFFNLENKRLAKQDFPSPPETLTPGK